MEAKLEVALGETLALFQVLLYVLPTLQAERQLRFVYAMLELKQTRLPATEYKKREACTREYFLQSGAEFELRMSFRRFRGTDSIYRHCLSALCKLQVVRESLVLVSKAQSEQTRGSTSSSSSRSRSSLSSGGSRPDLFTMEINVQAERLNSVIKNKVRRRALLQVLKPEQRLGIQFIAAVDHFLGLTLRNDSHNEQEQRAMGNMIVLLFLSNNAQALALSTSTEHALLLLLLPLAGQKPQQRRCLAVAREEILNQECEKAFIQQALDKL